MDVLILSCGTGGGHNSAGKAVLEEMKRRGHNAVMLNPYSLKSNRLAAVIDKCYISIARSMPGGFGVIYKLGDLYRGLPIKSPVYFVNCLMDKTVNEFLKENYFDILIMPHLFGAEILSSMKQHGINVPKTIFVATDYICTPFTEETKCDAYIIPAADIADDFINRGIPAEKIYPFGIPVDSSFSAGQTREEAKESLGLDKNKKYILIAGGSMGGGGIKKAIKKLYNYSADKRDTELIVICGSNKALYDKLIKKSYPNITVVEHTDDMAAFIKASHLFVTKAGGLSSTEAAVSGVPIFHLSSIPGCETYNTHYFAEHGMSISGDITKDNLYIIDKIINNEDISSMMIEKQKKCINPLAAADICRLAENLVYGTVK